MEREGTREIVNGLDRGCGKEATGFLLSLEVLDLLSIGLVVCNAAGQLLVANRSAEEILRTRDGLELDSDGALCAIRACGQSSALAGKAGSRGELGAGDAAFTIQRASGKRALTVVVRSIKDEPTTGDCALPAALVLILDSTLSVKTTESELHQLYGLTATEARLANLLTEGKALQDCCRELGISRSTACTHLRRLFKKTRVRRQSELVSLLLKSIGLARLGNSVTARLSMLGFAANTGHMVNHLLAGARETRPS